MKYLFSLFLSLLVYSSHAQSTPHTDSLQQQINQLRLDMSKAGRSLVKFNNTFTGGIIATGVGTGCTILGISMVSSGHGDNVAGNDMIIFGVGLVGVGAIISIFAHKHIKDAGIHLQGSGIAIPLSD